MLSSRQTAQTTSVDGYVVSMAAPMRRTLHEYLPLKQDRRCRIFRYEDIIFEKARWISEICSFFEWSISSDQVKLILGWADIVPEKEDPTMFVRRVRPGDHREKLSPHTISRLNEIFGSELTEYGYQP